MRYVVFPIVYIVGGFALLAGLFAIMMGVAYLWHAAAGLTTNQALFASCGTFIALMLGVLGWSEARTP